MTSPTRCCTVHAPVFWNDRSEQVFSTCRHSHGFSSLFYICGWHKWDYRQQLVHQVLGSRHWNSCKEHSENFYRCFCLPADRVFHWNTVFFYLRWIQIVGIWYANMITAWEQGHWKTNYYLFEVNVYLLVSMAGLLDVKAIKEQVMGIPL